jgi:hypothetical protein
VEVVEQQGEHQQAVQVVLVVVVLGPHLVMLLQEHILLVEVEVEPLTHQDRLDLVVQE